MLAACSVAAAILMSPLEPPNSPGVLSFKGGALSLTYDGAEILRGTLAGGSVRSVRTPVVKGSHGEVDQVFAVTVDGEATLEGTVVAVGTSFACASERPDGDQPPIVRNSYGGASSAADRAVYCRDRDWLVSFDPHSSVKIDPEHDGRYRFTAKGSEIILRFRPRYYAFHRGLMYFQPWLHAVWQKPVVGWCSWFAYFQDITESKVKEVANVLADKLKPFGLQYLQIDDGYQRDPVGFSDTWLKPNDKFPSGLADLAAYIKGKGLEPGIWSYTSFHKQDDVDAHPDLFVRDEKGQPAYGRWVGYSPDGSNPRAIDQIIKPLYSGYVKQGWDYYKVDSLRHLRYEGYNSHPDYFAKKGVDRVEAYRNVVKAIRAEIGDRFLLACWGIRPELVGLVDGCRIGGDGYSFVGLPQFNSFNNVVWRNDPDHIVLSSEEAYRSCLATTLSGALFMVTDKPERYENGDLEAVKRCIPVLFTQPGQVYDVDPSKSSLLDEVDSQVSGDGPRPFDAAGRTTCELFQLDIAKPFGSWTVLGRIPYDRNAGKETVHFADLGLDPAAKYHVYEFWSNSYLGAFTGSFQAPAIDPKFGCQCFCIRKATGGPQLIATSRHVTCGAVDLVDVQFRNQTMDGTSTLVPGDPYTVSVFTPGPIHPSVRAEGATVVKQRQNGDLFEFTLTSEKGGEAHWTLDFHEGR